MELDSADSTTSPSPPLKAPKSQASDPGPQNLGHDAPPQQSASGISAWAKNLKLPQPFVGTKDEAVLENPGKSPLSRLTSGLGVRFSPKASQPEDGPEGASTPVQAGFINNLAKGLVDSSKSAVKAVQVKARHVVSQNRRRYQEGEFDLDLTYITENIIAMGFPAGYRSSGFFGYVEGFYRNHMEEVIKFFETHHKDKYKVYNLCSERLYDASLFEGKVASFPFEDHNCPPIQLISLFCQSAYSWLKEDIENVVVVHCKAGMARTGLMISSLLLYLKFFPTAEESIDYYNQKRCVDGKGLVLPSQIRYVKYFERVLAQFNGQNQPGRRCMLRGFRLHRCPYWIRPSVSVSDHNGVLFSTKKHPRTKDLSPEDYWFSAPKKGIMVFALPGEPGLTELAGDFKIKFHDGQGDFYCWLNTTMIENRKILNTNDLDGFDKRKLPSPGFRVEVVLMDLNGPDPTHPRTESNVEKSVDSSVPPPASQAGDSTTKNPTKVSENDKDDVFSDSEAEESGSSKSKVVKNVDTKTSNSETSDSAQMASLTHETEKVSMDKTSAAHSNVTTKPSNNMPVGEVSDFKAMAADASVFSFGDEDDFESD